MHKILITYGTRPFAQRVGNMLASKFHCHYASSEPFPELLLKGSYRKIPTGVNPTFAHELLKLALDEEYQYILPLGKMELAALHEARVLFEEYGIALLLPEDLARYLVLENPPASVAVSVLYKGLDVMDKQTVMSTSISGVWMLSEDGDEPVLCLA